MNDQIYQRYFWLLKIYKCTTDFTIDFGHLAFVVVNIVVVFCRYIRSSQLFGIQDSGFDLGIQYSQYFQILRFPGDKKT